MNIFLVLIGALALLVSITGGQIKHPVEAGFTLAPCVCAISLEDADLVLAAYSMSDSQTLADLVNRRKAFLLSEGIQLHILSRRDRIAQVRVDSGTHIDNQCWLPKELVGHPAAH